MSGPYWTHQWNPISGCSHAGTPGCDGCWARDMRNRFHPGIPFAPVIHADRMNDPDRWRKPREVFVCNTGDLFHRDVPDSAIVDVLCAIRRNPQHTFLILTKRAERLRDVFSRMYVVGDHTVALHSEPMPAHGQSWIQNLWTGVTAEDQKRADERIPLLLATPAAHRWVSVEPMLSSVVFDRAELESGKINQIVVGAESGHGMRMMDGTWLAVLMRQCEIAKVPLFIKQIHAGGKLYTDPAMFPEAYRVRDLAWRQPNRRGEV